MKLARVLFNNNIYYTKVEEEDYYPLNGDFFNYTSISNESLDRVDRILSPIVPSKVIALGLNYKLHIKELHPDDDQPKEPVIFMKPVSSIIGEGDEIIKPKRSDRMDYEAELAFVISSDCKNVPVSDAYNYILGYTCLNDVTARDLQKIDGQWTRAKGYDTFCPIGPYIVTDIDPSNLEVKSILNGDVKQDGNTRDMIFSVPQILSYISGIMTLKQGDIISTGTPCGIGPMNNGDTIEIYIENVGTLTNIVKDE